MRILALASIQWLCLEPLSLKAIPLCPLLLLPLPSLHPALDPRVLDSLSIHSFHKAQLSTMKYEEILKWRQDVYDATIGQYDQQQMPAMAAPSRRANATWAISQVNAHVDNCAFRSTVS